MNIDDARELVSNPEFLKKMLELNSYAEQTFDDSNLSSEMKSLISARGLSSYALRCIVNRSSLNSDKAKDFLVLKNEFDNLILVDPRILKTIVCYVGSCVLSKIFTSTAEKKHIDLFKVVLGERLFSFVLNYGRYAPYSNDLSLKKIDSSCKNNPDELSKLVMLYGLRALVSITSSFSDPMLKEHLTKKLVEIFGDDNMNHDLVKSGESVVNVGRIYSLVNKIIKYESGR